MKSSNAIDAFPAEPGVTWPFARTCPFNLPDEYAEIRKSGPIHRVQVWDDSRTWLITKHEHARALLADPRITVNPTKLPKLSASDGDGEGFRSLLTMDPPDHNVLRRMLISEFSVRRVRAMRSVIQRTVHGLLDGILERRVPVDLVAELALPISTLTICQLLGVPYEDHEFFQERSERAMQVGGSEESLAALLELRDYLDQLVSAKINDPGDDLLCRLIADRLHTGDLQHAEIVDNAVLLLAAGHETTASMVALSILTLIQRSDVMAELRGNSKLLPWAVDELLRVHSIADGLRRAVTEDIELGGTTLRAGDGVIISLAASNRDESAFASPDDFDIHRSVRHHVAFGYGPHQCLGQNLARLELEVTLGAVIERMPTLRLAGEVDALRVKHDSTIFGLHELPVEW